MAGHKHIHMVNPFAIYLEILPDPGNIRSKQHQKMNREEEDVSGEPIYHSLPFHCDFVLHYLCRKGFHYREIDLFI